MDYQLSIILLRKENRIREKYKYNTKQFQIGMMHEKEHVVSPYAKLRDMVLGQSDFTKKQGILYKLLRDTQEKLTKVATKTNTGDIVRKQTFR